MASGTLTTLGGVASSPQAGSAWGKRRGLGPSWAGRRLAPRAAHRVEPGCPWGPTRPWVGAGPSPVRDWPASSPELPAQCHPLSRTTLAQDDVHQAVPHGHELATVPPARSRLSTVWAVPSMCLCTLPCFAWRASSALAPLRGCTPRLLQGAPPSDVDMATGLQQSRRWLIRTLRRLGSLEASLEPPVATAYEPTGRATVERLRMNQDRLVVAHVLWVKVRCHPPSFDA